MLCLLFFSLLLCFVPFSTQSTTSTASARCIRPSVRREWRKFSRGEKADWIRATKCLNKLPHSKLLTPSTTVQAVNESSSYYDDFVFLHIDLNPRFHYTGLFFPWHRWYLHVYENDLRTKCGYKGYTPYWDWSLDAHAFNTSDFFKDSDPISGLGGWGDPTQDITVQDGAFGINSSFKLSYPVFHHLRRNFTLQPRLGQITPFFPDPSIKINTTFTPEEVQKMINGFEGDYTGFQQYIERMPGPHLGIHFILGGDHSGKCPIGSPAGCVGGPPRTPNEPLFWMHHANLDRIWYLWQHKSPLNKNAYGGGTIQSISTFDNYTSYPVGAPPNVTLDTFLPADGLFSEFRVRDMMDTLKGPLCYIYE